MKQPRTAATTKAVPRIAGKFRAVRTDIGTTTVSPREIVVAELEPHLAELGSTGRAPADSDPHKS